MAGSAAVRNAISRLDELPEMRERNGMRIPNDDPLLVRVAPIARALGVSKRMLIADAEAGRLPIPLRLERFGRRGDVFVNADDARALRDLIAREKE